MVCLLYLALGSGARHIVCSSRETSARLLHAACVGDVNCRFLHDLASATSASDESDLAYERRTLGAYAERIGLLVSLPHPGTVGLAPIMWSSTAEAMEEGVVTAIVYSKTAAGTAVSECNALLSDPAARMRTLLPVVYQLVAYRALMDERAFCDDFNERPLLDSDSDAVICVCQEGKMCGKPGTRHATLLISATVMLLILVAVAAVALIYIAGDSFARFTRSLASLPPPAHYHSQSLPVVSSGPAFGYRT